MVRHCRTLAAVASRAASGKSSSTIGG
jgi:hypothetical protein